MAAKSFKDLSFGDRYNSMGDEAESIFEETYNQGFVRFGLQRPPIHLASVPPYIRFMPDYLTARGLVEVQGFGRDQIAKFKLQKVGALLEWHDHFRVDFFIWDSHQQRYGWVRLPELWEVLDDFEVREFVEGNSYWAVPAGELPVIEWVQYGDPLGVTR